MADVDPDEVSGGSLTEDLKVARPAVDRAALEHALARAEQALFGATSTARLGRFVLLGPIAGGGMGVVHGAYDPELDRRVALKLVHPRRHDDARAHERLLAEARALARLDHPNVVPVHDVLAIDEQVVIVMELVAGETLAAWEAAKKRSWREIVGLYVQVGRGLAAAHALGIVHRDVKPANAIVGTDGRVRVLDFGLARSAAATEPDGGDDGAAVAGSTLTETGERVGTVAYMAPEQLERGVATAASDQFGFCVALYRALHGVAPFAGDDPVTLLASMRAGRITGPSGRPRVPRWLTAAVIRGLAADPDARHPSMTALLALLERERGWRRWRGPLAAAALVGLALLVVRAQLAPPTRAAIASCDGGEPAMAPVWNPDRRGELERAVAAVGTPYATELGPRLVGGLDAYATAWTGAHRAACIAHRDGARSADLLDRQMACLDRRKGDLSGAVDVLAQVDRTSVTHAIDVVVALPPVAACAELDALLAATEPPTSPEARREVTGLRARLSHAAALDHAARSEEALAIATAARIDAERLGYPPTIIEAGLLEGRILLTSQKFEAAVAPLASAERLALATGQLPAAVEAAARRLYVQAMAGDALPGLGPELALLEPLSESLRGDHFARPLLLNNVGVVYMAKGDRQAAVRQFQAAQAALTRAPAIDLELTNVGLNLAMVTPDAAVRETLARTAWERQRDVLGHQHLTTIQTLFAYARYTSDAAAARSRVEEACALLARFHPDQIPERAVYESYRAFLVGELGDAETAATVYADVATLTSGAVDRDAAILGRLAAGHARLYRGDAAGALVVFDAIVGELAAREPWWDHQRAAQARLGAALAAHALGRDRRAVPDLEQAIATYARLSALNEDGEPLRRLALARTTLAEVQRARATR